MVGFLAMVKPIKIISNQMIQAGLKVLRESGALGLESSADRLLVQSVLEEALRAHYWDSLTPHRDLILRHIEGALNAAPPSETAAPRSPIAPTSWPSEEEAKSNYTFTELWQLGQSLTRPDGRICPHRGDAK